MKVHILVTNYMVPTDEETVPLLLAATLFQLPTSVVSNCFNFTDS